MMKSWIKLSAAALAASLLVACGGNGGADDGAVKPLSQMQPGERFAMETPLLAGGSQISHYVVHGVTPKGELVDSDRPGLVDGVRVSILESVTRDGRSSTSVADPATLQKQQQAFYQQLWDAMAEHEGTRDPQVILAEIDDLDARIVDLMDDVAASGVTLREYIAFYDRLDAMPEFAGKELAELNLREALSDVDKYSVLEAAPPACPAGLTRVVSQSGLSSYCRVPSTRKTASADPHTEASSVLAALPEPNLRALIDAAPTELDLANRLVVLQLERLKNLEAHLRAVIEQTQIAAARVEQLQQALRENGEDDQKWKTYCAQHTELGCVSDDTPRFGVLMTTRVKGMLDSLSTTSQMDMLKLQILISRRNEAFDLINAFNKKMQDLRSAILTNLH